MELDYYIFEILIYRVKEDEFYEKYNHALETHISKYIPDSNESSNSDIRSYLEQHFWETYGGPWNYNQAIGAIKLFVCGDQIRGDLWLSNKKRYTRVMGNKNISLFGKAFEMTVFNDMTNEDINKRLLIEISNSLKVSKRHVIDIECFINCSKYIDWKSLIARK